MDGWMDGWRDGGMLAVSCCCFDCVGFGHKPVGKCGSLRLANGKSPVEFLDLKNWAGHRHTGCRFSFDRLAQVQQPQHSAG